MFNTTSRVSHDIPDTLTAEELDYKPENYDNFFDPYLKYGSI